MLIGENNDSEYIIIYETDDLSIKDLILNPNILIIDPDVDKYIHFSHKNLTKILNPN